MPTPPDSLPDDASALKALLVAAQAENERLIAIIKELQRYRFGPRSEKIDPGQLALMLEDVEQAIAARAARGESQTEDQPANPPVQRKRQVNRGALPKHLPTPATIGPGAVRSRPALPMSTSPTANMNGQSRIWPASPESSRSMAMAPTRRLPKAARSRSRSAGRTCGESSSKSRPRPRRRSRPRRSRASAPSTPSSATSEASLRQHGKPSARPRPSRSSMR